MPYTEQIAKKLETFSVGGSTADADEIDNSINDGSDDIALYRTGGWAILSAKRFRESYMKRH